jgi:hypothetical protein
MGFGQLNKGTALSGQIKLGNKTFENKSIGYSIQALNLGLEIPNNMSKRSANYNKNVKETSVDNAYQTDLLSGTFLEPILSIDSIFNCPSGQKPNQSGDYVPTSITNLGNYINCYTCTCASSDATCQQILDANININNSLKKTTCSGHYTGPTGLVTSMGSGYASYTARTDDTKCPTLNYQQPSTPPANPNWQAFVYGPGYATKKGGCQN